MKLYGFPPSPNTRKVQALAMHLGIALEFQFVDLSKGEARTVDFRKLNPTARTPVLVDGDFILWESNAILQYLASQKPNTLWPDDARTRADIMRWQAWQLAHWGRGCEILLWENLIKGFLKMGAADANEVKRGEQLFHQEAAVLNAHLENRDWLVNNTLTIADFAVGAYLCYAQPARFPLESYSNIRQWYGRIDRLEAWRGTAPQM